MVGNIFRYMAVIMAYMMDWVSTVGTAMVLLLGGLTFSGTRSAKGGEKGA